MLRKKFLHLDFIGKIYLSVGIFSIIVLVFCIWLSNQRGFVQILPFSDAIMVYVDQNGHLYQDVYKRQSEISFKIRSLIFLTSFVIFIVIVFDAGVNTIL